MITVTDETFKRLIEHAWKTKLFEEAPCFLCGYNGPGYYQPDIHPCAKEYHARMSHVRRAV